MRFTPPIFSDSMDPIEAENWVKEMERIFKLIRTSITEEDKVSLATYMLKGESVHWWTTVLDRYDGNKVIEWTEFRELFLAKYFPNHVRYQLERDFLNLKQDDKSVLQYEQEFNRLSRYASALVRDESAKTRRFIEGLMPSVRKIIAVHEVTTFRSAVDKATIYKVGNAREKVEESRDSSVRESLSGNKRSIARLETPEPDIELAQQPLEMVNQLSQIRCFKCGGTHKANQCRKKGQVCFRCQETGHLMAECPVLASEQPNEVSDLATRVSSKRPRGKATRICYQCRKPGHLAVDCPVTADT
jgi:hypothetical protein